MTSNWSIGVRPLLMKTYPEYKSNSTLADAFYILKLIKKTTNFNREEMYRKITLNLSIILWIVPMDINYVQYIVYV